MTAMNSQLAPFSALTPDTIFNALDCAGLNSDGRLLALNSYENRVYQVGVNDSPPIIAKFYRPKRWTTQAILEEHAFIQALHDADIPVVPAIPTADRQTLHYASGFHFAVFPKQGGRVPELEGRDMLEQLGRYIARIHAVGALKPFNDRPTLDTVSFGDEPRTFLLNSGFIPKDLIDAYLSVSKHALERVKQCFERAGTVKILRLHGDCYPGNILWTNNGPHFVDFDDSRMGPAIQDLWMLLSGDRTDMAAQLKHLLNGYRMFYDFDCRELHLIEALRTLRLIHYSAWIARRWDDPAFPAAFPWFDSPRYWQDKIIELREQLASMDEGPLLLD